MQIVSVKLLKTVCNANSLLPVDCCGCFIRTSGARNPGVPALCADWTLLKRQVGYHHQKPPTPAQTQQSAWTDYAIQSVLVQKPHEGNKLVVISQNQE